MDNNTAWDIYFSTAVGWTLHPGYQREGSQILTIEDCAEIADEMLLIRKWRQKNGSLDSGSSSDSWKSS